MERGMLFELAIEDEVAGLREMDVAGEEVGVVDDEGFGVGEFGKSAVLKIGGGETALGGTEELRAERSVRVSILVDVCNCGMLIKTGVFAPGGIVGAQGFAIGVAKEGGAVVDLGRKLGDLSLVLGDRGEPAAEGLTVGGRIEAQEVGGAVGEAIAVVGSDVKFGFEGMDILARDRKFNFTGEDPGSIDESERRWGDRRGAVAVSEWANRQAMGVHASLREYREANDRVTIGHERLGW